MSQLRLVRLTAAMEPAFREMQADYAAAGESLHADEANRFRAYLALWRRAEAGDVPPGYVAWTTLWLSDGDGVLLGGIRLRHRLVPRLWQDGGHVGYDIRPGRRGAGLGTRMLALALDEARRIGLEWLLVTVRPDNTASIRVAEKNGARFIGVAEKSGMNRYRIDLGAGEHP